MAEADVVIVGGGTAGCVLAAALSADTARRVLLIEAGSAGAAPELAGLDYLAAAPADRFWDGASADPPVEPVAGQPAVPYRSGRGVGGSAAVNGMVAVPPGRADFDAWVAAGCASWSWDAVAPTVADLTAGWVPTPADALGPLEQALAVASAATGVGTFEPVALERSARRRASVAERLLAPALGRPNLRVVTRRPVERLVIEGDRCRGVIARGVEVGATEVVLAAGAIRSPSLVAASGLGDVLAAGRLTDHPSGTFTLHLREERPPAAFQTCGALRWRTASGAIAELLPIDRVGEGLAAVTLAIMDPLSTGSITPADGGVVPRLGMLDAARDRSAMREAITDALAVLASPAVRRLAARISAGGLGVPADDLADASDAVLDAWVATTGPLRHAGCSLPLGTVLDESGRVRGVRGLRVADASALPVLPAAAPNATVTVLAAHLAARW